MARRILVIGGTGLFGIPTSHRLKEDGFDVRVMTRDAAKAKKLFNSSFEIFEGDASNKIKLEDAMKDCHGVVISVTGPGDKAAAMNVSALAKDMGIKQIVYISGATVNDKNKWFPMIKDKLDAEKVIRKCGVPYTILRPTWPMEQLPRFVQKGKVTIIGEQPAPIHWFAVIDLARMISTAFKKKAAQNRVLYVHGPEAHTMKEAMQIYCKTFHPEIKEISVLPIWMAKALKLIIRKDMFHFIVNLMAYFDKAGEAGNPKEANEILDAPTITLEMWMKPVVEKKIARVGK